MPDKNLRTVLRLIRGKGSPSGQDAGENPGPPHGVPPSKGDAEGFEEFVPAPEDAGEGGTRLLDSADVERLLSGLAGLEGDPPPAAGLPEPEESSLLPGLTTLHHRFAATASATLSRLARPDVGVFLATEGACTLGSFLNSLPLPLDLDILALPPLAGHGCMACDSAAGRGLAAVLLGGRADALELGRDSTAIEQRLHGRVFRLLRQSYEQAWQHVHAVFVRSAARESDPHLAVVCPLDGVVHVARFTVDLEGATGSLWLCLPWGLLAPLADRLAGGDLPFASKILAELIASCHDLPPRDVAAVVSEFDPGMAVSVLKQMAPAGQEETLALLPAAGRERVAALLERSRAADRAFGPEEKLAVALLALGEERAAELLRRMEIGEAATLLKALRGLGWVRPGEVGEVLHEGNPALCHNAGLDLGGEEQMARLAKVVFDPAGELFLQDESGAAPFARLAAVSAEVLAGLVRNEQPATLAAVLDALARRDARKAGEVLLLLPGSFQVPALLAQAEMREPADMMRKELEDALTRQVLGQGIRRVPRLRRTVAGAGAGIAGGMDTAIEMLVSIEQEDAFRLLGEMEALQAGMARRLQARMFVFEDLAQLPGASIREILKEVSNDDLTNALKGASEKVRATFFTNLSERAARMIAEDIDIMGPVRLKDVEDAQTRIVRLAWRLSEEGRVLMWGGTGE